MTRILLALTVGLGATLVGLMQSSPASAAEKEYPLYEMRVYFAAKGKLDDLNSRFRDHTVKLFEKHGMKNIGYWVPLDSSDERLIYVIAHKDRASRDASFKAFASDPAWKKAAAESEKNGKLVSKIEYFFMNATDYSPPAPASSARERIFELRTYIATPNNLDHLNARFRDHTVKLFEKHGMTNVAYWNLVKDEKLTTGKLLNAASPVGKATAEVDEKTPAAPLSLIYMLAHKSTDAAKASFDAFRMDPLWVKARSESEQKAGGSLTAKDGVKSLMMKATDYSPIK